MPAMAAAPPSSLVGMSLTAASVMRMSAAIEAAFCSAERVTLTGSMTPILTRSPYSPAAAVLAGETQVPAVVRPCAPQEALEIQVFENLGLGVRAPLEPRDMANAIQTIAQRFETKEAAAEHFGRTPTWLNQATAAANLSPKVTALLDSGKISSTSTAIQLEKLAQKNEAKVDTLIEQIQEGIQATLNVTNGIEGHAVSGNG